MASLYTNEFYEKRMEQTKKSAEKIIEHLFPVIKPDSVIDFGCATGTWLAVCKKRGASTVCGVDGDWVDQSLMEIAATEFHVHNLNEVPWEKSTRFDLAISIEVAEHLSPEMGDELIRALTDSSDFVLFSAAIKRQGGTGHINEQPQSYWATRFFDRGYVCVDFLRPSIWDDPSINVIYKQNMLLYIKKETCDSVGMGANMINSTYALNRVHPDLYSMRVPPKNKLKENRFVRSGISLIRKLPIRLK